MSAVGTQITVYLSFYTNLVEERLFNSWMLYMHPTSAHVEQPTHLLKFIDYRCLLSSTHALVPRSIRF